MSTSEAEFDLELHFLPAWARKPQNEYSQYAGREDDKREFRGDRPPRRRDQPGRPPRRDGPGRGPRPAEARAGGERRQSQRGGRGKGQGQHRGDSERKFAPPPPLPEINCAFIPEDRGVESLAKQIKMTGRAYPLFEIAQLILQKPERHSVSLSARKNPEGQIVQPLFQCALDETVWLSEDEAIRHLFDRHFATFYQAEKTQTDPPKGTYTFVAQCGMSGVVLGPPNYHDYQNQLRKLHAERFSRMPFDAFKARVKIVKDEAVVKKWIEEQSWKTEYICLNVPEALKLPNREEAEKHFRQVHAPNVIKQVESASLTGNASRGVRAPGLARLIRQTWEDQRRFPLQVATVLSQKFAAHGLQFFKVNKSVTHVAVARPHYLDIEAAPVSDGIKRIVQFIAGRPKCTRRALVEALAPGSHPQPQPAADAAKDAQPPEATPEFTALVGDLHWLIHQGHVIEFATGLLETAKKPIIKPPKPGDTPPAQSSSEAPAETLSQESASASPPAESSEPRPVETTEPIETPVAEVATSHGSDKPTPSGEFASDTASNQPANS